MGVGNGRIESLDSLRGIAALIVVFNHFYNVVPSLAVDNHWLFLYTPLHWLIAGRQAVIIFFVLSGFVLALPYFSGRFQGFGSFIVRRICRIYIPFVVAICLAGLLWLLVAKHNADMAPHGGDWSHQVTAGLFFSHLLMLGLTNTTLLNPPMWTLIIEMRVSFIFSALVAAVKKLFWLILPLCIVGGYGIAKIFIAVDPSDNFYLAGTPLGSLLLTLYYVPFFLFGVMIAARYELFVKWMRLIPAALHFAFLAFIFFMPYGYLKLNFSVSELWYAVIAVYLILCCISFDKVDKAMSNSILLWLGKVSYSMYLIHLIILLTMLYMFENALPLWGILLIAFPLILLFSEIFNRWVELPSMKLGKWLTRNQVNLKAIKI